MFLSVKNRLFVKALFLACIVTAMIAMTGCATKTQTPTIEVTARPIPWTHVPLRNDPDNFQFAVVADRTGGNRAGIFETAIEKLDLLEPEFVMCVGDLIEGVTTDRKEIIRQHEEFDNIVESKRMPFFRLPGNHDISNGVMADIWKDRLGRAYYSFVYRDVLFLCLNSEDPPQVYGKPAMSDQQITYFGKVLEEYPNVRWTIVFMHKPMWQMQTDNWPRFEKLLEGRKHTVFAGHHHTYQKTTRNDANYYKLATTGGSSSLAGLERGNFDHVMWITMTDNGPKVANLLLDGILDDDPRKTGKIEK